MGQIRGETIPGEIEGATSACGVARGALTSKTSAEIEEDEAWGEDGLALHPISNM